MQKKRAWLIVLFTVLALVLGTNAASARDIDFVSNLNLTSEQIEKLKAVVETFSAKKMELEAKIDTQQSALARELRKADRWDSEAKNKTSAKKVNKIVKRLTSLGGDLLKLKVAYFLKAKETFTEEQRMVILAALTDYEMDLPDSYSYYLDLDLTVLDLNLTTAQTKKLLQYRADMQSRAIKHALGLDYKVLDLRDALLSPSRDHKKVDKLISAITDIGTKMIDNKVTHILRAKDVLTLEQKRALFHMMLVVSP